MQSQFVEPQGKNKIVHLLEVQNWGPNKKNVFKELAPGSNYQEVKESKGSKHQNSTVQLSMYLVQQNKLTLSFACTLFKELAPGSNYQEVKESKGSKHQNSTVQLSMYLVQQNKLTLSFA